MSIQTIHIDPEETIKRLRALVRAQQITIDKLEAALAQPTTVKWSDYEPDGVRHYKPAQPEERNFCPRCGKRTRDLTTIHTCTPPQENT